MGELSSWIGTLIQTLAILGTVGSFLFKMHVDLKLIVQSQRQFLDRVAKIEGGMDKLNQVLIEMARQDARQNGLEARIQELSNRLFEHIKRTVE